MARGYTTTTSSVKRWEDPKKHIIIAKILGSGIRYELRMNAVRWAAAHSCCFPAQKGHTAAVAKHSSPCFVRLSV